MSKLTNATFSTVQPHSSDTNVSPAQDDQRSLSQSRQEPFDAQENDYKPGIMFAGQDKLPKLPIPELESTCKKYLEALKPLENSHEQEDTENAVQAFLHNEGPELQARLKKYAAGKTSYLEQFCKLKIFYEYGSRECSQRQARVNITHDKTNQLSQGTTPT